MRNTEQTKGQSVLKHGLSVWHYARKLLTKQYDGFRLPQWWDDYEEEIYKNLYDFKTIKHYLIWHDAGKPDCLTIDEDGKRHFPNHAQVTSDLWKNLFPERSDIAELMLHDMDFHTLTAEQISDQGLTNQQIATLMIASLAELHSNANMFGGIESDSFKMKYKKWEKNAKKIALKFFYHPYMYILIRNDLSHEQKAVQSCHAAIEATREFIKPGDVHPSVIICQVKSEHKLQKCCEELKDKGINFKTFREPDRNNEMTALATEPLFGKEREAFKRFQLLRINK